MAITVVVRAGRTPSAGGGETAPANGDGGSDEREGSERSVGSSEDAGEQRELSLTFDMPRLVIGRGEGCELRLPDPSVSHRHASIRQRGGDYILVDEKSTNGTYIGRVMLPPQSPRVVRSGEIVRVGRVWLELRIEPKLVTGSGAAAAKELALELVTRGLIAQGEDPYPRVRVVEGPDAGKELRLVEPGRHYILGRARDADLALDDPNASRRHVDIARKGNHLVAHDLGSKGGATLDGAPLGSADVAWKQGQVLAFGSNRLAFEYPAVEALAELERSPDEPLRPGEVIDPPEVDQQGELADAPPSEPPPESRPNPLAPARNRGGSEIASPDGGFSFTDAAVVLLALGVLALSVAGLWLLFSR